MRIHTKSIAILPAALAAMAGSTLAASDRDVEFEPGEIIYENPLASEQDIEGWVIESSEEGQPSITFPNRRMRLESDTHFLLWAPEELPDNIMVEWEFQPRNDNGLAMFWIAARGRDGESIFDPALEQRDGTYSQYMRGDIDALHLSYFRRNQRPGRDFDEINFQTTNLRKSHGFHLVAQTGDPIPSARDAVRPYRMRVVKHGPYFRFSIDDVVLIDWYDAGEAGDTGPVLEGGRIGFRQMANLIADYRNLTVREAVMITRPDLPRNVYERLGPETEKVAALPLPRDGWRFQTDADDQGRNQQWYAVDFDDSDWDPIAIEQHWQEAGHDYVGPAWYRRTIDTPEDLGDMAVIAFEGVDESAWVWIDGHFIGEHDIGPAGWNEPFELEVTDYIEPGHEHQITIRAKSTANMGGVWEPVQLEAYAN